MMHRCRFFQLWHPPRDIQRVFAHTMPPIPEYMGYQGANNLVWGMNIDPSPIPDQAFPSGN